MLIFTLLLSSALATEYFVYPSLVAHFNPQMKAYNITFSGSLDTTQCEHDQMDCLGAVVVMVAKFQTYPSESTFISSNALMMCSESDQMPPEFTHMTHLGQSDCGASNFYGQRDVSFTVPLVEPRAQIKSLSITVSIEATGFQNPTDYDKLYDQKISLLNSMLGTSEKSKRIEKL